MEQKNFKFPTFVANQVLSPDNLNEVFQYLDEQERMTRVYLTGTGIVCGLKVNVSADGSQLTIGCGCGVTTEGYLIKVEQTTYNLCGAFDFTSTDLYQPFCNSSGATPPPYEAFPIYELYNDGSLNLSVNPSVSVPAGVTSMGLTSQFLKDMVVVLLCDMNSVQAQNCNTESCDGLGVTNTVSYKALLINKASVYTVFSNMGLNNSGSLSSQLFYNTPELNINRFNVYSSSICTSGQFFAAYEQSFPQQLLVDMQNAFGQMYGFLNPLVSTMYSTDPFSSFANNYSFLNDGSLVNTSYADSLIQLQYYYDYFINLMDAYNELRDSCMELSSVCCPDNNYPRHLFLGLLQLDSSGANAQIVCQESGIYYANFVSSGAVSGNFLTTKVTCLYNRLVLLYQKFKLPSVTGYTQPATPQNDAGIRITPTISGIVPLSDKSIPFYYDIQGTNPSLVNAWSYQKNLTGKSTRNLSYWASNYSGDTSIIEPLKYDLEKFNFLRVEGIIGKNFANVVFNLQALKSKYRLPFDIVVTTTGSCGCSTSSNTNTPPTLADVQVFRTVPDALFTDLELDFNAAASEIICRFIFISQSLYRVPVGPDYPGYAAPTASRLPFLQGFVMQPGTYGSAYEKGYLSYNPSNPGVYTNPMTSSSFSNLTQFFNIIDNLGAGGRAIWLTLDIMACNTAYIMQYICNLLQGGLDQFVSQINTFNTMYGDLVELCDQLIALANDDDSPSNSPTAPAYMSDLQVEDIKMLVTELRGLCKGGVINDIVTEYNLRLAQFANSISFDCFSKTYPGLQHRAGVPIGGTLVLVVHYSALNGSNSGSGSISGGNNNTGLTFIDTSHFFATGKISSSDGSGSSGSQKSTKKSSSRKELLTRSNNLVYEQTLNFNSLFTTQILEAYAGTLSNAVALENTLDGLLQDGIVIADFFLPDCVVSDVPPAQIFVGLDKQPPFVSINPATYVLPNPVNGVSPAITLGTLSYGAPGGILKVDGITVPAGNDFEPGFSPDYGPLTPNFNPSNYSVSGLKRSIPITYTLDSAEAQTAAYIYKQPLAYFVATRPDEGANVAHHVFFNYTGSKNYNKLYWTFGDGTTETLNTTSASSSVTHVYPANGGQSSYTVVLTAFNDSIMDIYVQSIIPSHLPYIQSNYTL